MGIFTILANLIVLGIVGIVLTLFRKADKNSKSLEQVKKYASKRNDEFDLYVEEKMTHLKDMSVSLEVQEKTGIVILNRISGEVDILSGKIEHIEELNRKVTGYNSTMDKMLSLSKELDERYGILKKDSVFLEQIDKKIKDSKRKLYSVEKNIDEIASEFIKNNNNSINKLKDEVFSSTNKMVEELEVKVNKSSMDVGHVENLITELNTSYQNSAKESYDTFKEDLNILLETHRNKIIKITSEGESLEEASFSEIKDKINLRSSNLLTILEDKLKSIEDGNRDKISKLSIDMGNVEVIANKIKKENRERLDSIKNQIDNQLLMLKDVNSKGVTALQEEFAISFNEFKEVSLSEIEKTKIDSELLITGLKEQFDKAQVYRDEVVDKLSSAENYVGSEFRNLQDRVESSVYDITRELETHEEKIRTAAFNKLEKSLELYRSEVEVKLEDLTSVKDQITFVKKELTLGITDVKDEIDSELNDIKYSVKGHKDWIDKDIISLKETIIKDTEDRQKQMDDDRSMFSAAINEIKINQNALKEELIDNEKEIRAQVVLQRNRLITNVDNDINDKLGIIKDEFISKINSFTNFEVEINRAKIQLEEYMTTQNGDLKKEVFAFHEDLSIRMDDEKSALNEFIESFNHEKIELEREILNLKERSYNNISEKLNIFEDEYFVKLKEKKDHIDVETDVWRNKLVDSVKIIQEDSINTILENMEVVHVKVNNFKEVITDDFSKFKIDVENKVELLITNMQSKESVVLNETEEFKTKAINEITNLRDQLNLLNNEVNNKSDTLKETLSEISVEQSKYITETEIFTRTDKLKSDLEESIEILTDRLNETKEKSDFVIITNEKLNNLRNLIESINGQIESIDNKRVKVETLENRVSKVLELSDSVDDKLSRIKDSESRIDDIQLKLRELKELEESVSLEFHRLENKESILEVTNKAIDSGFSQIQIIENKLDLLKENITPFNNQIDNIKDKLSRVEGREQNINRAIDALSTLNGSIDDVETKIEKMDKARTWIAGVETRLNESVRTADEQVKLMGALAQNKNETGSNNSGTSAPNMNMRDMVTKLAHNGWKPEDIARTTKLSRGEVELILELSPRK